MDYKKLLVQYRARREKARKLLASGMPAVKVGKLLGITRQRVYQITK